MTDRDNREPELNRVDDAETFIELSDDATSTPGSMGREMGSAVDGDREWGAGVSGQGDAGELAGRIGDNLRPGKDRDAVDTALANADRALGNLGEAAAGGVGSGGEKVQERLSGGSARRVVGERG